MTHSKNFSPISQPPGCDATMRAGGLKDAESALTAAEDAYEQAKKAGRDAAAVVKEAKARLKR